MTTVEALNLAAQSEWIPVSERLPERETDVLIASALQPKAGMSIAYLNESWERDGCLDWFCSEERFCKWLWAIVTHWRPLPEGPK
jgi:hypothetical protein